MNSVSLLPVSASPKDFKAVSEKLAAAVKASGQNYTEFQAVDEISLNSTQRESYRVVMNQLESVKRSAEAWRSYDNASTGIKDLNPEKGRLHAIYNGAVVDASWDEKNQPTRYSNVGAPSETTNLFQETNEAIIFAQLGPNNSAGVLFDKSAKIATIFTAKK